MDIPDKIKKEFKDAPTENIIACLSGRVDVLEAKISELRAVIAERESRIEELEGYKDANFESFNLDDVEDFQ